MQVHEKITGAPFPMDENSRIKSLHDLNVLDTNYESAFDAIVELAANVCETPICLISLIDDNRQWFKANHGLPGVSETPRELAFCAHAILQNDIFEVPDAQQDSRFYENPLVTTNPKIRFYAGATLKLSDGSNVGTLCVIDKKPRQLSKFQQKTLRSLAFVAVQALQGRRALIVEKKLNEQVFISLNAEKRSTLQTNALRNGLPFGIFSADADGTIFDANARCLEIFARSHDDVVGHRIESFFRASDRAALNAEWQYAAREGKSIDLELTTNASEAPKIIRLQSATVDSAHGQKILFTCAIEDLTALRNAEFYMSSERRKFDVMIESTRTGTWEWNVLTGEARVSAHWAGMIGYTVDELGVLSVDTWRKLTHPKDLIALGGVLDSCLRGEKDTCDWEGRLLHRSGYWVWVHDKGSVISKTSDGAPEWLFGTRVDITNRKKSEILLSKNQRMLHRTGEVANVGGWELDLTTGRVSLTSHTRLIKGIGQDDIVTLDSGIDFYHEDARPIIKKAVENAIKTGAGWDLELPFLKATGESIWVRTVGSVEFEDGKPARLFGALQDITIQRAAYAATAQERERHKATLCALSEAVVVCDERRRVSWMNPVAEQLTGWSHQDADGKKLGKIVSMVHQKDHQPAAVPVDLTMATGERAAFPERSVLLSRQGLQIACEGSVSPLFDAERQTVGCVVVFRDVTSSRIISDHLLHAASHDSLTGLKNRKVFEEKLLFAMALPPKMRDSYSLLYIDLDNFKIINDSLGHSAGDELLRDVAEIMKSTVRVCDTVFRLGGDEFSIILENCDPKHAVHVAKKICCALNSFVFHKNSKKLQIGASIGIVSMGGDWDSISKVINAADAACYAAKKSGRNCVRSWSAQDSQVTSNESHVSWAVKIKEALRGQGFKLYAQAIKPIKPSAQNAIHVEILLRLLDHDGKINSPAAFMPAIERFDLCSAVDIWVISNVVKMMLAVKNIDDIFMIHVNISAQSFGQSDFQNALIKQFDAAGGIICKKLCLEITETSALTDIPVARDFMLKLRTYGVTTALDDFGAGASSFSYLKNLPITGLKIDGQFIKGLPENELDKVAVTSFVQVAKTIGASTVAEFVDDIKKIDILEQMGVDYAQGYAIHMPEPFENIIDI